MEDLTEGPKWHPVMMLQVYPCLYLEVKQHFSVYFHSSVEMINRTNLWKCKVHTTYIGYAQCPVPWIKIHPMLHCFGIWPLEGTWNCLCSLLPPLVSLPIKCTLITFLLCPKWTLAVSILLRYMTRQRHANQQGAVKRLHLNSSLEWGGCRSSWRHLTALPQTVPWSKA